MRLQRASDPPQLGRRAMANRDDELGAGEHVDLPELDGLGLVDVARRSQDEEQRVPVALQLRALMCVDRVLQRELMEVELARNVRHLLDGRLVEPEPRDAAPVAARGGEVGSGVGLAAPLTIQVDGAIDDHAHTSYRPPPLESANQATRRLRRRASVSKAAATGALLQPRPVCFRLPLTQIDRR